MAEEKTDPRRRLDEIRRKKERERAGDRITLTEPVEVIAPPVSKRKSDG